VASAEAASSTVEQLAEQERQISEAIEHVERQLLALKGQYGQDYDAISNEALALRQATPFGIADALIAMHPRFLITQASMGMGALGALMFILPNYIVGGSVTISSRLGRFILGIGAGLISHIGLASLIGAAIGNPLVMGDLDPGALAIVSFAFGAVAYDLFALLAYRLNRQLARMRRVT
jgi:hypothetical protein